MFLINILIISISLFCYSQSSYVYKDNVIICKEFDFKKCMCDSEIDIPPKQGDYYKLVLSSENELLTIEYFSRSRNIFNYKLSLTHENSDTVLYRMNGILFKDFNHSYKSSRPLLGEIVINQKRKIHLFKVMNYDLLETSSYSINDIEKVFLLNDKLFPIKKIVFQGGYISYKTEFDYSDKDQVVEWLYLYNYSNCLEKNNLLRNYEQLYRTYLTESCDSFIGIVHPNVLNHDVPLWLYNTYQYGKR